MRRSTVIPLLIIIFLVFGVADNLFLRMNLHYSEKLEEHPLIVLVYSTEGVTDLQQYLNTQNLLTVESSEKNVDIIHKIGDRYGFSEIGDVVDLSTLPHVIRLQIDSKHFSIDRFGSIIDEIEDKIEPRGSIIYSTELIIDTYHNKRVHSLFHLILRSGTMLLLFLTVFLADRIYLATTETFWSVLVKSGGERGRYKNFVISSVYCLIVPYALTLSALFLMSYFAFQDYYFDIRIWMIKLALIVAANQIAWLTHKH